MNFYLYAKQNHRISGGLAVTWPWKASKRAQLCLCCLRPPRTEQKFPEQGCILLSFCSLPGTAYPGMCHSCISCHGRRPVMPSCLRWECSKPQPSGFMLLHGLWWLRSQWAHMLLLFLEYLHHVPFLTEGQLHLLSEKSFAFLCISVWVADRWLWWTLDQVLREEKSFSSSSGHWASQPSRKKNTLEVICRIIIMPRIWYFFPMFQQADEPINVGSYLRPSLGFAVTDTMSFAQSFVERIILSYLWPVGTEHWCTHQWFLSANSRLVSILAAVFWTYRLFKKP